MEGDRYCFRKTLQYICVAIFRGRDDTADIRNEVLYSCTLSSTYRPADRRIMHPEEIRDCLHGVIYCGIGGDHSGFQVGISSLVMAQWLGERRCTREISLAASLSVRRCMRFITGFSTIQRASSSIGWDKRAGEHLLLISPPRHSGHKLHYSPLRSFTSVRAQPLVKVMRSSTPIASLPASDTTAPLTSCTML